MISTVSDSKALHPALAKVQIPNMLGTQMSPAL